MDEYPILSIFTIAASGSRAEIGVGSGVGRGAPCSGLLAAAIGAVLPGQDVPLLFAALGRVVATRFIVQIPPERVGVQLVGQHVEFAADETDLLVQGQDVRRQVVVGGRCCWEPRRPAVHLRQTRFDRLELVEHGVGARRRVAESGVDGVDLVLELFEGALHLVDFEQFRVDRRQRDFEQAVHVRIPIENNQSRFYSISII